MKPSRPKFVRTDHHPFKTCGNFNCSVCTKSVANFRVRSRISKDTFFGNSPAPFIGRYGYPSVNVGILSPPGLAEDAWVYDAPLHWSSNDFQIPEIVGYRASLVNAHSKGHVKSPSKMLEISREVGMASMPVEVEMFLKKKPVIRMSVDSASAPVGPSAPVAKASITSNPKIHTKVDKVHSDSDLKASEALLYLYDSGFDEGHLSRVLSVGSVGLEKNRKLVPTRWSITASDDIIGRHLSALVKNFSPVSDFLFYFGGYLGNFFAVFAFPDVWSYELFESFAGTGDFTSDYEGYEGRKRYVDETAGGYYASRLAVLESLRRIKRQASVFALRIITPDYTVPLGCWVVREAMRKSLQSSPLKFASREEMVGYAGSFIRQRFGTDLQAFLGRSRLFDKMKFQRKLSSFF